MGLGPVVCPECLVCADLVTTNQWGASKWTCPQCSNTEALDYMWMFTEEQQAQVTKNSRFIKFITGQDA
jgi:hypothetical protein